MALPAVSITTLDGGLAVVKPSSAGISAKVGSCTSGTANQIYTFQGTDTQDVLDTLGEGPLVDAVCHQLIQSGGKTCHAVRATTTTAGTNSAVTASGGGPTVTLTGTPDDDYIVIVEIVTGGAVATATFKYTLDNGDNYSEVVTTASTYLLPNGVTLNFAAGTYVAEETYSFTCTGPKMTSANVQTALDVLIDSAKPFEFIHICGTPANAADIATIAAAVQSKMAAAMGSHRYAFAVMETTQESPSTVAAAIASVSANRVMIAGGFCELSNDVSGRVDKRSVGRCIAARIARVPISVSLARNPGDTDLEAVPGIISLIPDGSTNSTGYYDAAEDSALHDARCTTLRHWDQLPGYFVTDGLMMTAVDSDFHRVQNRRVMDRACEITYLRALRYVQKKLRIDTSTGYIAETQALAIENDLTAALRSALVDAGHASGARAVVNRADSLLSDPTLRIKVRIVPFGYANEVEVEIGFATTLATPAAA
jgi:hypothetical protein